MPNLRTKFLILPGRGSTTLPSVPAAVGVYLGDLADQGRRKASTIARRAFAIARAHRLAGADMDLSYPTIQDVLAEVGRARWGFSDLPNRAQIPARRFAFPRAKFEEGV